MPSKCPVKYRQKTEMGLLTERGKEKLKSLSFSPLLGMASRSARAPH